MLLSAGGGRFERERQFFGQGRRHQLPAVGAPQDQFPVRLERVAAERRSVADREPGVAQQQDQRLLSRLGGGGAKEPADLVDGQGQCRPGFRLRLAEAVHWRLRDPAFLRGKREEGV